MSKEILLAAEAVSNEKLLPREKIFEALSLYISLDDEKTKARIITEMLFVVGHGGKIKYYQESRLAMLCRMLYRQLKLSIN